MNLHSRLFLISMLAMASMEVLAVSTGPKGIIIETQQPDGTKIKMKVVGDEYNRAKYTLDGYTITQDALTKEYRYADETKSGKVYASDKIVGKDKPPVFLKKGIVVPGKELSKMQKEYHSQRTINFKANATSVTSKQQAITLNLPALQTALDVPELAPPAAPTVGTQNGFCMLISFADDPVTPDFAPADINTMFNGPAPIWGNAGSIKQYFFEQSNGKMTLNTTVSTANVRLSQSRDYYDNAGGLGAVQAVKEALNILLTQDPAYFAAINLTTMNSGGKQVVKAFSVFYPGNPGNNDLWPHSWILNNGATQEYVLIKPGVYVSNYQMSSLLFGSMQPVIGVACHEIGHMLCDFSDYYDYGDRAGDYVRSYGLGNHCLMSDSANTQYPAQINPYLRFKAGWINVPLLPESAQLVTLTPTNFYQYAKSKTEYFIFSNVQKDYSFWTQYLPAEGIAIWHIDEKMPGNELQQMTTAQHYECSLEQADGLFHLEQRMPFGNSGEANDLYFLGNSSANYPDKFSNETTPSSRWWDGTFAEPFLASFSVLGWTMTMMLDYPPPVIVTTSPLPEGRVGSPYGVQFQTTGTYKSNVWALVEGSTLPPGLSLSPSGMLSGVPTLEGTNTFDIFVRGRSTITVTNTFELVIISAYAAPFTEGFNSVMESYMTGWHQESVSNNILWRTRIGSPSGRPLRPFEGEKNAYLGVFTDSGSVGIPPHATKLISPMIRFGPHAREVRVSFAYYLQDRTYMPQDVLKVYYKTAWSNNWTGPIATYTAMDDPAWTQQDITLPISAAGKGVYLAFEGWALGGHGVSLDAIQIYDPVPPLQITTAKPLPIALCETNYTLAVPLVTLASVGGFTNALGLTSYQYAVVNGTSLPSGFTLTPAGVIIGISMTPIAMTYFDVEITDLIGGVVATNTMSFAVEYPRVPVLDEDFITDNILPTGWTMEYVANTVDWKIGYAGGKDTMSPPAAAHSDLQYAFFFGTPGVGTEMCTKLVSPVFDLTQMPNNTRLVFWHFMQRWSGQDQLRVYCRNAIDAPWTKLATYTNNVTSWTQRIIPLPDPTKYYQIAFEGMAKSGYGVCVDTVTITDDGGAPVILTRDVLPSGFDNFNYETRLEAVGGIAPYQWAIVSNGLPRGLTLDSVTGIISGIPVGATQTVFRVAVTGYDNKAATNIFSLKILPPGLVPFVEKFVDNTLPEQWVQVTHDGSYAQWKIAAGTYSTYNPVPDTRAPRTAFSNSLPYNVCLWAAPKMDQTAEIATLVTKPYDLGGCVNTTVSFQLCMKQYNGNQDALIVYYRAHETDTEWTWLAQYDGNIESWALQTLSLPNPSATYRLAFVGYAMGGWGICVDDVDVRGERTAFPLEITTPTLLPEGTNQVLYPPVTLAATGGTLLPYTWRVVTSDILPPGLTLDPNTGVISGTPTQAGLYTFGVTVQDANSVATTGEFSLRIRSGSMTPFEEWKSIFFPLPDSYLGDDADQSGDGIANLLKYGMGLNPTNQNLGIYILGGLTNLVGAPNVADGRYLYLGYRRSLAATDLDFFVKGKTDLGNVGQLWLTNNVVELTPWTVGEAGVWSWVYNVHTTPATNAPQRFLRLEVELKP
jgi:M6 family metalloprotease-like protein